jgi:hypothetical protein
VIQIESENIRRLSASSSNASWSCPGRDSDPRHVGPQRIEPLQFVDAFLLQNEFGESIAALRRGNSQGRG